MQVLNAFEANTRFYPRPKLNIRHAIVLTAISQVVLPFQQNRV